MGTDNSAWVKHW